MIARSVLFTLLAVSVAGFAQDSSPDTTGTDPSDNPIQVRYAANLGLGESYINIVNTGANGAPLLGPGLGAQTGNLCVNVYAFDPGEEMISCCSCLVTPDQVVNLGVNRDLTAKTLTGVIPSSVTVKLLATLAGGNGAGTTCANSAATQPIPVSHGLAAWGTTLHAGPNGTVTTETSFTTVSTSNLLGIASEIASLTARCAYIIGNASTFGVCSSCRAGALGAAKQ